MSISSRFFDLRQQDEVAVLTLLPSQLSEEENLEQLDEEWYELIEKQKLKKLVLDLSNVRYMTSAALGRLIGLHRELSRQEGKLILCALQKNVTQTLETSRLIDYFNVVPSENLALEQLATC